MALCNTSLQVQSFLVFHFIGVQYWYVVVNSLEQYFVSKWSASWESPDDLRPAIMSFQVGRGWKSILRLIIFLSPNLRFRGCWVRMESRSLWSGSSSCPRVYHLLETASSSLATTSKSDFSNRPIAKWRYNSRNTMFICTHNNNDIGTVGNLSKSWNTIIIL